MPSGADATVAATRMRRRAASCHPPAAGRAAPHRGEQPLGVPVGERLLEAAAGDERPVQVEDPRQEPSGQAIPDHDQRAGGERGLGGAGQPPVAHRGGGREEHAQVEQEPLHVVEAGLDERRPRERDGAPRREPGEPRGRHPAGGRRRERERPGDREHQHERPCHRRGGRARCHEEAAAEEGEHRRAGQEDQPGQEENGAAHARQGIRRGARIAEVCAVPCTPCPRSCRARRSP